MKRTFIIGALALTMGACTTLPEELHGIEDITGVEIGKGANAYEETTYRGAKLPDADFGRDEMIDVLTLIGKQKGEIDDELFESLLTEKLFRCEDRFMLDDDNTWTWAFDWVGRPVLGTIMPTEEGIYYEKHVPGCGSVGDFGYEYMYREGYQGWYSSYEWSYDAETHTLKTTTDYGFELEAEVLYFDGSKAVLLGHVGGVAWIGWKDNHEEVGPSFEEELYLFEFSDGRDKFLEGYLTWEEYNAMMEEFLNRYSEYEGAKMPEKEKGEGDYYSAYEEMMDMLNYIEIYGVEVRDEVMRKRLDDSIIVFHCTYTQRTNDEGEKQWQRMNRDYINAVMCNNDGSGYASTITCAHDGVVEQWMAAEGYNGWYENIEWNYDESSNILRTSNGDITCEAEVVYFDGTSHFILRGHIAGISETMTNELGEVSPQSDVEFFDVQFGKRIIASYDETTGTHNEITRDNFTQGFYSYEDYCAKADEYAE